jgi:hypothetical protein
MDWYWWVIIILSVSLIICVTYLMMVLANYDNETDDHLIDITP